MSTRSRRSPSIKISFLHTAVAAHSSSAKSMKLIGLFSVMISMISQLLLLLLVTFSVSIRSAFGALLRLHSCDFISALFMKNRSHNWQNVLAQVRGHWIRDCWWWRWSLALDGWMDSAEIDGTNEGRSVSCGFLFELSRISCLTLIGSCLINNALLLGALQMLACGSKTISSKEGSALFAKSRWCVSTLSKKSEYPRKWDSQCLQIRFKWSILFRRTLIDGKHFRSISHTSASSMLTLADVSIWSPHKRQQISRFFSVWSVVESVPLWSLQSIRSSSPYCELAVALWSGMWYVSYEMLFFVTRLGTAFFFRHFRDNNSRKSLFKKCRLQIELQREGFQSAPRSVNLIHFCSKDSSCNGNLFNQNDNELGFVWCEWCRRYMS